MRDVGDCSGESGDETVKRSVDFGVGKRKRRVGLGLLIVQLTERDMSNSDVSKWALRSGTKKGGTQLEISLSHPQFPIVRHFPRLGSGGATTRNPPRRSSMPPTHHVVPLRALGRLRLARLGLRNSIALP